MPLEAPVMRTRLPRRCRSMGYLAGYGGGRSELELGAGGGQHCTAALRWIGVWFIASPSYGGAEPRPNRCKEPLDEQRKETIPDRGHPRRRDRQGSHAGGTARHRAGCEAARRRRSFRPFRFRLLRLLREAWPDDAGRLEGADRQARRDLFRRRWLAREDP